MKHHQATGRHSDRGSTAIGAALALPLVFLVVFLAVQAGLWFFARSVVLAAAQEGARAAAARDASLQSGLDTASAFADRVGGTQLADVMVSGERTGTFTTVTVTAQSVRLVPLLDLHVSQTATLPTERLT